MGALAYRRSNSATAKPVGVEGGRALPMQSCLPGTRGENPVGGTGAMRVPVDSRTGASHSAAAELVEPAVLALPRELDGPVPNSAVAESVEPASGLSKEGLSGFTGPASLAAPRLCRGGVGGVRDLANSNRLDSAVAESAMRIQLGRALLD